MDTGSFAGWEGFGGRASVVNLLRHIPMGVLEPSEMSLEYDLEGVVGVFWEESEINTELLMFVPSIDLFLCLPFILLWLSFFLSLFC